MKKIKDIMTEHVDVIHPKANLLQAAEKMKKHNVGVLPVCDGDKLRGMITDRDSVIRGLADKRGLEQTHVSDVMSKGVYYCYEEESINDAVEIMQDRKVRRLVVLNKSKRLVGLLSLEDLAIAGRSGEVIRKTLIEASHSERSGLRSFWSKLSPFFYTSGFLGAGYYLYNQRKDLGVSLRKVLPSNFLNRVSFFNKEQTKDFNQEVA